MDEYLKYLKALSASSIADALLSRQHVRPHQALGEAVELVAGDLGVCPNAGAQALRILGMDRQRSIGRFRRAELAQLGQAIQRLWQRANAQQPVQAV